MNKILSILLLISTPFVFAAATDDNEVMITQVGDTLKLYVDPTSRVATLRRSVMPNARIHLLL